MTQSDAIGPNTPRTVVTARAENSSLPPEAGGGGQQIADNVDVVQLPWWQMIGVRALRVYLQSLVGLLGAAALGGLDVPAADFADKLWVCAGLAIAPACISLLQNSLEILTKLDTSRPQLRA